MGKKSCANSKVKGRVLKGSSRNVERQLEKDKTLPHWEAFSPALLPHRDRTAAMTPRGGCGKRHDRVHARTEVRNMISWWGRRAERLEVDGQELWRGQGFKDSTVFAENRTRTSEASLPQQRPSGYDQKYSSWLTQVTKSHALLPIENIR